MGEAGGDVIEVSVVPCGLAGDVRGFSLTQRILVIQLPAARHMLIGSRYLEQPKAVVFTVLDSLNGVLRLYLKYHTSNQILCGFLVGGFNGALWFILLEKFVGPYFPIIASLVYHLSLSFSLFLSLSLSLSLSLFHNYLLDHFRLEISRAAHTLCSPLSPAISIQCYLGTSRPSCSRARRAIPSHPLRRFPTTHTTLALSHPNTQIMGHKGRSKRGHRHSSGGGGGANMMMSGSNMMMSGGNMMMSSGGFETLNMDQMNIVEGGSSGFMASGGSTAIGFPSAGIVSGNGMYSITLADGNCVEVDESCMKQSRRSATKFSCMVDGVKHKIKSHQIAPCVATYSQSEAVTDGDVLRTITQAFYAPVVGYYSVVLDEKVVVVSGREMEKHSEKDDIYIIRVNGESYEIHATAITFLGEFVLEPDREMLTDEGESTPVSSEESDTSDSDASVSGRDEIVEDANVYTTRTFKIRKKTIATCYRIRLNGSELVVPVSQVSQCKTRPGMLRISYYNKTYFINTDDIELQYETEVTGFYSVTVNGNPVILTGDDIDENTSDGTYICYYKNSRYVLAQTQIMYLGDYPVIQAPNYMETEVESSEESDCATHPDEEFSEEEPQMCIFVNEKPNMDMTLPEPTQGSVMGWKVYIDGRFYTVPANRLKQLRNAPGFMEIIVNRKLYHVSIENIQPIMLPTVYFITIQNKPILVPAKDVRRHPTEEGYVIVKYRGQDYVIAVSELKLADGSSVNWDDIPMDHEYLITRTTKTTRRIRKKKRSGRDYMRTCSPLCDKVRAAGQSDDDAASAINADNFAAMAQIAGASSNFSLGGATHVVAPGGVVMGQGGFGHHLSARPASGQGLVNIGASYGYGGGIAMSSGGGHFTVVPVTDTVVPAMATVDLVMVTLDPAMVMEGVTEASLPVMLVTSFCPGREHLDITTQVNNQSELVTGHQPIRDQYFLIRSVATWRSRSHRLILVRELRCRAARGPSGGVTATRYLGHVTGYQPIKDQYFLIRSVHVAGYTAIHSIQEAGVRHLARIRFLKRRSVSLEPTKISKQPIRTRCLGHVTGYQPIRDQYTVGSWCRDTKIWYPGYFLTLNTMKASISTHNVQILLIGNFRYRTNGPGDTPRSSTKFCEKTRRATLTLSQGLTKSPHPTEHDDDHHEINLFNPLFLYPVLMTPPSTPRDDLYCRGISETGEQLEARCSYPSYKCSCINSASDPPVCHCTRIVSEEEEEEEEEVTEPSNTDTNRQTEAGWNPLYVLGVGCSILMVLILTSTACCCLCRQYYSRQMSFIKPPDYSDSPPPPYPATPSVPTRTAVISRGSSSREIRSAASRDLFSRETPTAHVARNVASRDLFSRETTTTHVVSHNIAIQEAPRDSVTRDLVGSRDSVTRDLVGSRDSFRACQDSARCQRVQTMREIPLQHRSDLRQMNRDPSNEPRDAKLSRGSLRREQSLPQCLYPRESVIVSPGSRESIVVRNSVIDNIPLERDHLDQRENASFSRNTTAVERDSSIVGTGVNCRDSFTATTTGSAVTRDTPPDGTYNNNPRMNTGITRGLREISSADINRPSFLVGPNTTSPDQSNRPSPAVSSRGEIENPVEDGENQDQITTSQDEITTSGPIPDIVLPSYRQGLHSLQGRGRLHRCGPGSLFSRPGRGQNNNAAIMLPTYGQGLDLIIEDTGEFGVFYAPDEPHHKKMHGLLVDEYIEDRDTDEDDILSFNEWAGPIVGDDDLGTGKIWEMEMKARFRDADENRDGELHHPEVEHFLFPLEEDSEADEEALHILDMCFQWSLLNLYSNWRHSHLVCGDHTRCLCHQLEAIGITFIDMFHVCQLSHRAEGPEKFGMVRFGSVTEIRFGSVRFGTVKSFSNSVRFGSVENFDRTTEFFGQKMARNRAFSAMILSIISRKEKFGMVRFGSVTEIRFGSVRFGTVKSFSNSVRFGSVEKNLVRSFPDHVTSNQGPVFPDSVGSWPWGLHWSDVATMQVPLKPILNRNRPKQVNNQSELVIWSRQCLSANQGPVFPDSVGRKLTFEIEFPSFLSFVFLISIISPSLSISLLSLSPSPLSLPPSSLYLSLYLPSLSIIYGSCTCHLIVLPHLTSENIERMIGVRETERGKKRGTDDESELVI
eukprot:sb/3460547/